MMELVQCLANNGVKVTFVNTEFNHERVMKAMPRTRNMHELITLVSVPDGLESGEDRTDLGKVLQAMPEVVPAKLEALIEKINGTQSDGVTCLLTDAIIGWTMQVAEKFCSKRAAFFPATVALLAITINAEKLVDDGIIDSNGTPLKNQLIQLSPSMPEMSTLHFAWACLPDLTMRKTVFEAIIENNENVKLAQWLICNSSYELEPGALDFLPSCLPIGPLLASSRLGKSAGYFWSEDSTCLAWLDQQPTNSVIYVAFGSFTIFYAIQFQELALGLEITNRPFLWVVRQDTTQDIDEAYPVDFKERVKNQGKIVHWAPQQQVLSHHSVACFVSHCGWNSTIESIGNGVPFLCWPYFADQFLNQSYIVDQWEVGLGLAQDESGIIRQEEIKNKVEQLLTDKSYKARALKLQAKTIATEGGSSQRNLHNFVNWIKEN